MQKKEPITCETFLEFQFISHPELSPDGKRTAFLIQQADRKANGYSKTIAVWNHETGRQTKLATQDVMKSFAWQDAETLLFLAVRNAHIKEKIQKGEEWTSCYSISVKGGEAEEKFSLPLKVEKITPIGGEQYIVYAIHDNNRPDLEGLSEQEKETVLKEWTEKGHTVFDEVPFWSNGAGIISRKRQRLYQYDHLQRKLTPITEPFFQVEGYRTDGKSILYVGAQYDTVRPVRSGLYWYNIAEGTSSCLIEPGKKGIKLFELSGETAVLNLTDGTEFGEAENGNFYLLDLNTGERKLLAEHTHHGIGNRVITDSQMTGGREAKIEGDALYFITTVNQYSTIEKLNLKTGESRYLTKKGTVSSLDVQNGRVVMVGFRDNRIGELYELQNGAEIQLTHLNDKITEQYQVMTPDYLESGSSDGTRIQGWVIKPAGYVPGNRYPGILHIHGGPRMAFSDTFMHEMQLWANQGYFVFYCNPHGGEGRGNEFADIRGKYGTIDYEDLMTFTSQVLQACPDIDPERLGVTGGSYGGFMTNWIIGHTDRFRAACSQRCISNWTTFEGTSDIGYYFTKDQTGVSHTEGREKQWNQSPLKFADRVTTPTLFIHGEKDYRCWKAEALQMFTALKMHGVEARLCILKGENHELSRSGRPLQRIKRMEEILAWFEQYLKGRNRKQECQYGEGR